MSHELKTRTLALAGGGGGQQAGALSHTPKRLPAPSQSGYTLGRLQVQPQVGRTQEATD